MSGAPQHQQPEHNEYVRAGVKETIKQDVELEAFNGVRRLFTANHMMPLNDLVQNYSVKEPAKAKPK